jgi:hypothetical protein
MTARRNAAWFCSPIVRSGLVALIFVVAGCAPESNAVVASPAAGTSAQTALEEFALLIATAEFIDEKCRASGVRKAYTSPDRMIRTYVAGLQRQGYSEKDLLDALDKISIDEAAARGFARLKKKGVREGDAASVCRVGRSEIAADSAVGRLLRNET